MGYLSFPFPHRSQAFLRGVTLIELLVSITIVSIIGAVIVTNQGSFNKSFLLSNTAYDVALSIRDAEIYGIGSRGYTGNVAANVGYGIEFSNVPSTHYLLFADSFPAAGVSTCHPNSGAPDSKSGNCVYDAGSDTLVTTYTLGNAMKVTAFCGYDSLGTKYCSSAATAALDITFTRPNTTAIIYALNSSRTVLAANLAKACVTIATPKGDSRALLISTTGEVEFLGLNVACP